MLTYARGEALTGKQFTALKLEGDPASGADIPFLLREFENKVEEAIQIFKQIPEDKLTQPRSFGREKLPSTVIGLLFHAAEHSQRHVRQLLVTVSVL